MRFLVSALLGVATLTPLVFLDPPADPRSDPDGFGGRVVVSSADYAVTFPDDWEWFRATADDAATVFGADVQGEVDPETERLVQDIENGVIDLTLVAYGPGGTEDLAEICTFLSTPAEGLTLEELVLGELLSYFGDVENAPVVTYTELPVGLVARLDSTTMDPVVGRFDQAAYILKTGETKHIISCTSPEPPIDRWASIADSFESLRPQEASPGPVAIAGGRIERADDGFAVTFPATWSVEETSLESHAWLYPPLGFDVSGWRGTVLASGEGSTCAVIDATGYAEQLAILSPFDATEWELQGFKEDPPYPILDRITAVLAPGFRRLDGAALEDEVSTATIDLPAGTAGVIDAESVSGRTARHYLLSDDGRWFYLDCWSDDAPPDRWLSIAESFEFLPQPVPDAN